MFLRTLVAHSLAVYNFLITSFNVFRRTRTNVTLIESLAKKLSLRNLMIHPIALNIRYLDVNLSALIRIVSQQPTPRA